ncbi:MAG: potassium channel family protein [Candidatus Bathyarchaeales archaeon]
MPRIGKIEYKPVSVRDVLTEMKNLSELMIDLAYSAALFNSKELAEDVHELEERVDTLAYLLDMNAMIAARDAEDAESLVGVSVVASAADKISDAAADIAAIVIKDIGVHPIVREAFEKVEEQLARVEILSGSLLANKKIWELKLAPRIGVDIIAIRHGESWFSNPKDEDVVSPKDVVFVRGTSSGIETFKQLAAGVIQKLED